MRSISKFASVAACTGVCAGLLFSFPNDASATDRTRGGRKAPSPGGVWTGTITFTGYSPEPIYGEFDENGFGYMVKLNNLDIYSTPSQIVTNSAGSISMTFNHFVTDGVDSGPAMRGTGTFVGSIVQQSTISGTFAQLDGTFHSGGTFALSFVPTVYDLPASLKIVAGTYNFTYLVNGATVTASLTIDETGVVTGTDLLGCAVSGTASIPSVKYNAYVVQMTLPCQAYPNFTGYYAFVPATPKTPKMLIGEFDNGTNYAVYTDAVGQ
jgi:hypothetical protein